MGYIHMITFLVYKSWFTLRANNKQTNCAHHVEFTSTRHTVLDDSQGTHYSLSRGGVGTMEAPPSPGSHLCCLGGHIPISHTFTKKKTAHFISILIICPDSQGLSDAMPENLYTRHSDVHVCLIFSIKTLHQLHHTHISSITLNMNRLSGHQPMNQAFLKVRGRMKVRP